MAIPAKQKLIELSKEVSEEFHSDIVVQIFQFQLTCLLDDRDIDSEAIKMLAYDIEMLIDVFNPRLYVDVQILMELEDALDEWASDVDFVDKALDIEPDL